MARNTIPELDYLTQVCFELYESETKTEPGASPEDPKISSYSIRVSISPGCHINDPLDMNLDSKHCIGCSPRKSLTSHLDWKYVVETLRDKFHRVKLPSKFIPINLGEASLKRGGLGASPNGLGTNLEKVDGKGAVPGVIIEEQVEMEIEEREAEERSEEGQEEDVETFGDEETEEGGVEIGSVPA